MFAPTVTKYAGPINGRDVRAAVPSDFELPYVDDEEDEGGEEYKQMKQYLSIYKQEEREETLSMVYACPCCEVRIANEDDMVTRPYVWHDNGIEMDLNAVFKKTYNLVRRGVKGSDVSCYRCGTKLFDYCRQDPFLLTIPMYKEKNQATLLKREYRQLVLMHVPGEDFFHGVDMDYTVKHNPRDRSIVEQKAILNGEGSLKKSFDPIAKEMLEVIRDDTDRITAGKKVRTNRIITLNYKDTPLARLNDAKLEQKVFQELNKVHADLEADIVYWEELEKYNSFANDQVYDLAVLFRVGGFSREYGITHTDKSERYTEKMHLLLWLVSGGNFLFADWLDFKYHKVLLPDDVMDRSAEAKKWTYDMHDINKQPAFGKLIADGHFLGRWNIGEREKGKGIVKIFPPSKATVANMKLALEGSLLYPNWLFLHDYPSSVFVNKERQCDAEPYSYIAKDNYKPRRLSTINNTKIEHTNSCNTFVKKVSSIFN